MARKSFDDETLKWVREMPLSLVLVALIGRWVTKTGAWSTAFGRERFYLFIVCAVVWMNVISGILIVSVRGVG